MPSKALNEFVKNNQVAAELGLKQHLSAIQEQDPTFEQTLKKDFVSVQSPAIINQPEILTSR